MSMGLFLVMATSAFVSLVLAMSMGLSLVVDAIVDLGKKNSKSSNHQKSLPYSLSTKSNIRSKGALVGDLSWILITLLPLLINLLIGVLVWNLELNQCRLKASLHCQQPLRPLNMGFYLCFLSQKIYNSVIGHLSCCCSLSVSTHLLYFLPNN